MVVIFIYYCAALRLMMLFLALILILSGLYIYFLWTKRRLIIMSWNTPGPLNLPIIGAAYYFWCRKEDILNMIVSVQKLYPTGGKFWFGYGFILAYSLHEPEHIKKILSNPRLVTKDLAYRELRESIGEGILIASTERWKRHRRNISPSFNQRTLNSSIKIMSDKGVILSEILRENCDKEINIETFISRCVLDVLCESLMGVRLDIQETNKHYHHTVEGIFPLLYKNLLAKYLFLYVFGYDKKETTTLLKELYELSDKIIQMKMESKNKEKESTGIEEEPSQPLAFLDYIMETGKFSEVELKEEIISFFLAGTTSISTLTFLLAVLGMYPEIQQNVYDEVMQIVGNERQPEYTDLPLMVYTERVIKETLRLFPSVPHFLRTLTEDVNLGDFGKLPKGAQVVFGLVFIHRNPKYWSDPLKFDPDRFLPEEIKKRHPYTYIPFSMGNRNCIGKKSGMMIVLVVLISVVRKFKINCGYKDIEDIKVKMDLILRFRDGAKISLTSRT